MMIHRKKVESNPKAELDVALNMGEKIVYETSQSVPKSQ